MQEQIQIIPFLEFPIGVPARAFWRRRRRAVRRRSAPGVRPRPARSEKRSNPGADKGARSIVKMSGAMRKNLAQWSRYFPRWICRGNVFDQIIPHDLSNHLSSHVHHFKATLTALIPSLQLHTNMHSLFSHGNRPHPNTNLQFGYGEIALQLRLDLDVSHLFSTLYLYHSHTPTISLPRTYTRFCLENEPAVRQW